MKELFSKISNLKLSIELYIIQNPERIEAIIKVFDLIDLLKDYFKYC